MATRVLFRNRNLRLALVVALTCALAVPAGLALSRRAGSIKSFGPGIDDLASYHGQEICSPSAKPGVLAFQRIVHARHPATGSFGISRACDIGGRSEHKEGRAWDWKVDHSKAWGRAAANDVLDWLLEANRFGQRHARVRRFGVMYMIWNKRIWTPWYGWSTYCTLRNGVCYRSGAPASPHTDHVHFSFTWAGARQNTTWWRRHRSLVTGISSPAAGRGYLLAAGNGSVLPSNTTYYGSKSASPLPNRIVDTAARPSGDGYWLLSSSGKVWAFGAAPHRGDFDSKSRRAVAMSPTPTGRGYWILGRKGRVFAHGDAQWFGGKGTGDLVWSAIAPTPTGLGYWLFSTGGQVAPFGDAVFAGEAAGKLASPVVDGAAHGSRGYWLATEGGGVRAFGSAPKLRGAGKGAKPLAGLAPSASGDGYWLALAKGKVIARGSAPSLRSLETAAVDPGSAPTGARPSIDELLDF